MLISGKSEAEQQQQKEHETERCRSYFMRHNTKTLTEHFARHMWCIVYTYVYGAHIETTTTNIPEKDYG